MPDAPDPRPPDPRPPDRRPPDAPAPDRPEARFYHLTAWGLERAAPELLGKCRARGWRVLVRAGSPERVEALSTRLWSHPEDGFLAHGIPGEPFPERQPIWLTAGAEAPNAPDALMLVDGAEAQPGEFAARPATLVVFDGADDAAVAQARAQWKRALGEGARAVYWAQDPSGRWVRRAEAGG